MFDELNSFDFGADIGEDGLRGDIVVFGEGVVNGLEGAAHQVELQHQSFFAFTA